MSSPRCFLVLAALAACGPAVTYDIPPNQNPNGSNVPAGSAAPMAAGDETIDVGNVDIKGVVFEPQVLESYGVNGAAPKKPTTLAQERATYAKQKDPLLKQAHATILATMLYQESGKPSVDRNGLLNEARQALADAVAATNNKADELTLELLGRYSLFTGDFAGAEKAWDALVTQYPKSKDVDVARAWWVYSRLKQYKNADAATLVQNADISKTPELAYVAAWARWRAGDAAGAWEALKTAARAWNTLAAIKANPDRLQPLIAEMLRLAARTGVSNDDLAAALKPMFTQPGDAYEMWKKIATAMHYAGRWADAVAADQKAIDIGGAKAPADERVALALEESQFETRLDDPDTVAKTATDSVNGLATCGSACAGQGAENVVLTVAGTATYLHSIYASANDPRYYQPAHDLYALTIPQIVNPTRKQSMSDYMGRLEQTHRLMKPNTGRLGKDVVGKMVEDHNQEVQACFEAALAANPKVGGTVTLTLDIEPGGTVRGATSDPKAGMADVSLVAGCVVDRSKTWKFPARGSKGSTRATVKYTLAPRS